MNCTPPKSNVSRMLPVSSSFQATCGTLAGLPFGFKDPTGRGRAQSSARFAKTVVLASSRLVGASRSHTEGTMPSRQRPGRRRYRKCRVFIDVMHKIFKSIDLRPPCRDILYFQRPQGGGEGYSWPDDRNHPDEVTTAFSMPYILRFSIQRLAALCPRTPAFSISLGGRGPDGPIALISAAQALSAAPWARTLPGQTAWAR